jgi:hypothetical protein
VRRDGHEHVGAIAEIRAREALRCDAYHGDELAVQADLAPHDVLAGIEPSPPEARRQNRRYPVA